MFNFFNKSKQPQVQISSSELAEKKANFLEQINRSKKLNDDMIKILYCALEGSREHVSGLTQLAEKLLKAPGSENVKKIGLAFYNTSRDLLSMGDDVFMGIKKQEYLKNSTFKLFDDLYNDFELYYQQGFIDELLNRANETLMAYKQGLRIFAENRVYKYKELVDEFNTKLLEHTNTIMNACGD